MPTEPSSTSLSKDPPSGLQISDGDNRVVIALPKRNLNLPSWFAGTLFIVAISWADSRFTTELRFIALGSGILVLLGIVILWLSNRWLVIDDDSIAYRIGPTLKLAATRRVALNDFDVAWDEEHQGELMIAGSRAILIPDLEPDQARFLKTFLQEKAPPAYWSAP